MITVGVDEQTYLRLKGICNEVQELVCGRRRSILPCFHAHGCESSRPSEWIERAEVLVLMFAAKREEWRKAQVSREGKGKKGPEYSKLRRIGQQKRKRMQAVETTPHRIIKNSTIRNAQCAGMTCRRGRPLLGHTLNDDPRIAGRNVIVGDPKGGHKEACVGAPGPTRGCRAKFRVLGGARESLVAPWGFTVAIQAVAGVGARG
jgi:hypothetical protein